MKQFLAAITFLFLLLPGLQAQQSRAQASTKNGVLYMGFGTNLSYYGHSDISLRSGGHPSFDFTIYDVSAKDDRGLNFGGGGAAQYSYQVGYYFKKKNFGIEFNFDHIKYFIRPNQVVRLRGTINGQAFNTDTALHAGLVQLEHSDGGNYALFNFVKWKNLSVSNNKKNSLDLVLKAGAGPVIPKTNSTIIGKHSDVRYKISGYVIALEGGVKYNVGKVFYVTPSVKGAYANYSAFEIADGLGQQKWLALHFNLLIGAQLDL